jgi:4-amino-4-deoxychorismate lyase
MSTTAPEIVVNGKRLDAVSTMDRGLLYGDGVFETIAVQDGKAQRWECHMERLRHGCQRLGIVPVAPAILETEAESMCQGVARAVLKIIITRGTGGRGYRPVAGGGQTRILQLHPWPDFPERFACDGVAVRICNLRLGQNPALAGIKHLNRLEQVLARAEWDDGGIPEGLLLDQQDCLVEGTMSNVFLVQDEKLVTPDLAQCGVAGVMRAMVLSRAVEAGIVTEVRPVAVGELFSAQEVFLCNSIIGIWTVSSIDGCRIPSGKVTGKLQGLLRIRAQEYSGRSMPQ